jgi:hypothetical protein
MKMLEFLNKPYPFNDDLKHNAKIILFISLGILAYLLLFQPLEITTLSTKKITFLIGGFVAATFLVLSVNLIILPSLFPKAFYSKWNVKKEIFWDLWLMLSISGSDFLFYTQIIGIINIDFYDVARIMLLGLLPVIVLITINQERLLRYNLSSAKKLNEELIEKKQKRESLIHFKSDYKSETLIIKPDLLVLIKTSDNYLEIYFKSGDTIKTQMIRSTLVKAEELLKDYFFIFRCHRSYIININYINEIKGNYQGYQIFLENIDFPVMVSQKYITEFKKRIGVLQN